MKHFLLFIALLLALPLSAQQSEDEKYLAGAVPVNEAGFVEFKKTYTVRNKSKGEIYHSLKEYTQREIVEGENHLEQARITEADSANGMIAASMEEYLYFKRKAWTMDRVRFYYQLVFEVTDSTYTVTMRNLHYLYDDVPSPQDYRAENWITDEEALNKAGTKLNRVAGKFRRFTIDRKDEIFLGAARAAGAVRKVVRYVEEEE